MPRPKRNRKRINITLPQEVIDLIDDAAKKANETRGDAIERAAIAIQGKAKRIARRKIAR